MNSMGMLNWAGFGISWAKILTQAWQPCHCSLLSQLAQQLIVKITILRAVAKRFMCKQTTFITT